MQLDGATMGTTWRVLLAAPAGFDEAAVRDAVERRLRMIVAQMSQWVPDSVLSRFNRAAPGTWAVLPADFARVIDTGLAIAAATDGAFDPAMGRLVDLWGFGPPPFAGPPDDDALAAARAVSGWRRLVWARGCLRQPGGLALDLAGVAKGHAVDAVADRLVAMGHAHCLVEIGGELAGRGLRPDGEPWWVDLEAPPGITLPPLRIALHGLAIATSGSYRRGEHTLDPRTGRPAATGIVSASVVARTAMEADSWATALTVLGTERGAAVADRQGIAARFVTASGSEYLTSALMAMLVD